MSLLPEWVATRIFGAQVTLAREKHADFDQVVYNEDLQISKKIMRETIVWSENGAALAYRLGQHPEEAARIARLSPLEQVTAIRELRAALFP